MAFYRFKQAAHRIVTTVILLTVVITTFAPQWAPLTQAATDTALDQGTAASSVTGVTDSTAAPTADLSAPVAGTVDTGLPRIAEALVPMNTLILSEAGAATTIETAIEEAGGSVYMRQGDALFAGVEGLDDATLTTLGARMTYRDVVADSEMSALAAEEQSTIAVWNSLINRAPMDFSNFIANGADASSVTFLNVIETPTESITAAAYDPTDTQTSSFLYGDVAVQVVFVESTGSGEDWTETEVNKVKAEVSQALDWWSTVSPVPAPGGEGNPSAHVSWDVSYYSNWDNAADFAKTQIVEEPIDMTVADAADPDNGWMQNIANAFTGTPGNAGLRQMADTARDSAETDWGMVLFVVDSSNDADGRFPDLKISGAALNGPWAVVTYDGGDLGIDNLEVPIAKMVGHVFGAGDEGWTPEFGGCRPEEVYGYLLVNHTNCEYDLNPKVLVPSLMRSGEVMVSAYGNFQLSEEARGQVGWQDGNGDGVYDVVNNMQNGFTGYASDPVCPVLHFGDVPIINEPFVPEGYALGNTWPVKVFDPEALNGLGELVNFDLYSAININAPQAVWGRVNSGPWELGYSTDGNWDSKEENYDLTVSGWAGVANNVELIVLDRWENPIITDPVVINVAVPPDSGTFEAENRVTPSIDLFDADGNYESGWTSQGSYMASDSGAGNEACFTFDGRMARVQYVPDPSYDTQKAQVYVDGELHSFIYYDSANNTPLNHLIANLSDDYHTVQIVSEIGPITMDNFNIWAITPADVIHGTQPGGAYTPDVNSSNAFFYENSGIKYFTNGTWSTIGLPASSRPGTPDASAKASDQAYNRLYMFVDQAHIAAIYREVGPGMGTANVYVDGKFRGVMNNEASYSDVLPFYIGGLDPNPIAPEPWYHAIEIRVNEDSIGVNVDAVRVLYKDDFIGVDFMSKVDVGKSDDIAYDDPLVTQEEYGTWAVQNTARVYQSREMGSALNFFFEGTAIAALVRTNVFNGGSFEMYVDGKLIRTVNTKTAGSSGAPIIAHGFDPDLPHVLQIRHINVDPTRLWFTQFRGFRVYNIPPITPAECGIDSGPGRGGCEEYTYGDDTILDPQTSVFLYEQLWKNVRTTTGEIPSDSRTIESRHRDARAYLYVTEADTVTLYSVSSLANGTIEVWVNGDLFGTWNLRRRIRGVDHPYTITGLNPTETNLIELRIQNGRGLMAVDRVVLYNRPVLVPNSTLEVSDPNATGYENDGTVDGVPALQFSGQWRRIADENSSNGNHELAAGSGDRVEFDVEGASSVVIYRRLHGTYGEANIYVNGELQGSFNSKLYSPTGVYQKPYTVAGLNPYFKNRIRIEAKLTADWRGNLTSRPFDIDYVIVRQPSDETVGSTYLEPGFYDDSDAQALGGGAINFIGDLWTVEGDVHRAATSGHKAQVIFEGNAFTAYINKGGGLAGRVELYVDGQLYEQVSQAGSTENVPITVVGLEYGTHVAELTLVRGLLQVNAFQVYHLTAEVAPTYDLTNPADVATFDQSGYLLSEEWAVNANGFLETVEKNARLFTYLKGGDTLWLSHAAGIPSGIIEIYVNGDLTATLDSLSIRLQKPDAEGKAEYMVGGLMFMQDEDTWIEIRKSGAGYIQLKSLRIGNVADLGTLEVGTPIEAEQYLEDPPPAGLYLIGPWARQPRSTSLMLSGGFEMQSNNPSAKALIVVTNTKYLTVYRTMKSTYGEAAIYVDGEYWGNMPNQSRLLQYQVPFTVGPLDPSEAHAIEIRQTNYRKYSLDYIETTEALPGPIGAGFYENDDAVFNDAYIGNWTLVDNLNASGGTQHRSRIQGSRMTFTFTGNKLTIYRQMFSIGGAVNVYIDGNPYSIFNRSQRNVYQEPYTIVLPTSSQHQFEMVVGPQTMFLDAIEIGNIGPATYGSYQHDAPQVIVNSDNLWNEVQNMDHSGSSYIWTNRRYASLSMLFYGQSVQIYTTRGRGWGMYSVFLDGEFIEEVDLYLNSKTDVPFFKYEITGLTKENHVLEFRFEGHKNKRVGVSPKVNFDAFTVDGAKPPLPGEDDELAAVPRIGCFEESDSKWVLYGAGDAWLYIDDPAASGDVYLEGQAFPNVAAEFMFQSSGFTLLFHTEGGAGQAIIEVDGTVYDVVDQANVGFDSVDVTGLDPNKLHVLRVRQGGGGSIFIDRLDLPTYNPSYDDNCRIQ